MQVRKVIIGIFILGVIAYPQAQAIQINKSNILKGSVATFLISASYLIHNFIFDDSSKNQAVLDFKKSYTDIPSRAYKFNKDVLYYEADSVFVRAQYRAFLSLNK